MLKSQISEAEIEANPVAAVKVAEFTHKQAEGKVHSLSTLFLSLSYFHSNYLNDIK